MFYIARAAAEAGRRLQVAVEMFYDLTRSM